MRVTSHISAWGPLVGFATMGLSLIVLSQGCGQLHTSGQDDATAQYVVDPAWPNKPDNFTWDQTPGVTADSLDHVYVFTRRDPAVQVYDPNGTLVRAWNVEDSNGAHFIRIGPAGNVWAANIKATPFASTVPKASYS